MYKIEFGKLIGQLLNITGQKNYALAVEIGYDVSYVSKMINSKIYPASKNAMNICQKIASFIISASDERKLEELADFLEVSIPVGANKEEAGSWLKDYMEEKIYQSYTYSTNKETMTNGKRAVELRDGTEENNAFLAINPRLRRKFLNLSPGEFYHSNNQLLDIVIMANFFSLKRDDKIHFAGLQTKSDEKFELQYVRFRFTLSLDINAMEDIIFDTILFIYLVTNYSSPNFELYATDFPSYTIMMAVKDHYVHVAIQGVRHNCLMSSTSRDTKAINDAYETIEEVISVNSHPVFEYYSPQEIIRSKNYMRSIIGKNIRILIGSINELFLPTDLFNELAEQYFGDDKEVLNELYNINIVLNNATYNTDLEILFYEQTINNYILTGELHFFNKVVYLTGEQRRKHIEHLVHLIEAKKNIQVKIVKGYFIEEFKQYGNPSLFLSNVINYIRITSENTAKTLLVVKDNKLDEILDTFFEEVWENRPDVVIENGIVQTIEFSLTYMKVLEMTGESEK